jgi:hypothetical protein
MRTASCLASGLVLLVTVTASCSGNKNTGSGFGDKGPGGGDGGEGFGGNGDGGGFGMQSDATMTMTTGGPTTCAAAASSHSYIGCDYWPTSVANAVWSIFDFAVVVANTQSTTAMITVTGPGGSQNATVGPGQLTKIYLGWNSALKGPDADNCGSAQPLATSVSATKGAYHLVSSVPVTVYQFNALEYAGMGGPPGKSWASCPGNSPCSDPTNPGFGQTVGCFSFSNDASLLLPSSAMTGDYRIMGIQSVSYGPGMGGLGNYFAVTGTQDGTTVSVTLSNTASVAAGGSIQSASAGGTLQFTLNAGDVAEVIGTASSGSDDLSGSLLKASQPVQVIAGISCIAIPENTPGLSCDHVEESVFPAETLGKHYVVTVPTGPTGQPVGHLVRFYGNAAGTTLTYAPSAPAGCPITLGPGDVVECGIVSQDFEVTGTHEFGVGSFMESAGIVDPSAQGPMQQGDPSMSFPTAVEQYRTSYIFLAPTDYEVNYADVVVSPGTTLTLDGAPVGTAPKTVSGSYSVVRIKLDNGSNSGAHTLTGNNPFGIQVLGYGSFTSYQYPGGLDLSQIAPPPSNNQ